MSWYNKFNINWPVWATWKIRLATVFTIFAKRSVNFAKRSTIKLSQKNGVSLDEPPPHFLRKLWQFLLDTYQRRWIRPSGTTSWHCGLRIWTLLIFLSLHERAETNSSWRPRNKKQCYQYLEIPKEILLYLSFFL